MQAGAASPAGQAQLLPTIEQRMPHQQHPTGASST
jgi:hypothetical protein